MGQDRTRYRFAASPGGEATVKVRWLFRRAYIPLMDQTGWTDPDMLMESKFLALAGD